MKSVLTILGICLIGTIVSGCRTPVQEAPSVEVVAPPVPALGTLALIRIEPEPSAEELFIYKNGALLAVIGNYSYITLELSEGSHLLTLDWDDTPMKFEEEIVLDWTENTNKYLSVRHKFDIPEISKSNTGTDYTMVETLAVFEVSEKIGSELISSLDPDYSYVFESDD